MSWICQSQSWKMSVVRGSEMCVALVAWSARRRRQSTLLWWVGAYVFIRLVVVIQGCVRVHGTRLIRLSFMLTLMLLLLRFLLLLRSVGVLVSIRCRLHRFPVHSCTWNWYRNYISVPRCVTPTKSEWASEIMDAHNFNLPRKFPQNERFLVPNFVFVWRKFTDKKKVSDHRRRQLQGGPKKTAPNFSCNNFGKYGPILIMFSLLHSQMNWEKG